MFEEYLGYWHDLGPGTHQTIKTIGMVLGALLAGHFLGSMVARTLRNKNFDLALRMPGSAPAEHGMTPTFFAGMLVRLTVWAAAAGWFAHQYGRPELAETISLVVSRAWAIAGVLTVALSLGGVLARRLMDCFEGPKTQSPDPLAHHNGQSAYGAGTRHRGVAGIVGAGSYFFVGFVVLLMCADFFDWPLTRNAATALWQLAQNLLLAGSALGIGYLGARWARELATPDNAAGQMRTGQYTAMGIVASTTVLAVGMMLASTGVMVGLVALTVLGVAVWLLRGYLPDVAAGLQLRAHQIREVWFEGNPWQVAEVGFLSTAVSRAGAIYRVQNRQVLEARFQGAPAAAVASVERN
jgi:hypothetical protein